MNLMFSFRLKRKSSSEKIAVAKQTLLTSKASASRSKPRKVAASSPDLTPRRSRSEGSSREESKTENTSSLNASWSEGTGKIVLPPLPQPQDGSSVDDFISSLPEFNNRRSLTKGTRQADSIRGQLTSMVTEKPAFESTAHSLTFTCSTSGRSIYYRLQPSLKKSRATFLRIAIDDGPPKRVKKINYDDATRTVHDGKENFTIQSSDTEAVMKKLILLCKIARVPLDCINGSPELKKVLASLDVNGPLRRVLSCDDVSERKLCASEGSNASSGMRRVTSSFELRSALPTAA
mmetsp:Transcript_21454/g.36843  ORF Transcript_21454/g.36843 Transcript_21454/m.36843 type:complete len:291 (+) Transcript_21454:512-1384(+)|eukprot:CAMPEP_0183712564 /NCGR_PEP_ID=MMETSP0737-20130205/7658_1 /TAXON_ID=385413 /ORGANISM="Thalassiosira miniscula, Strain CCMP1093" /LENGTH=290 /DNA_ID=CAMNT_0025941199 /DNA_START=601 /DNA_END=1473 /DNA_ORIENTATION=+